MLGRTTGILNNHPNRLEATNYQGIDAYIVTGEQYTDNMAAGCCIPNGIVFDAGPFDRRAFEGYYAVRVFFDTTEELDPYEWVGTLEIYEDGVLKVWNTGDHIDGKIKLIYADQTRTLGSRIVLWFDPNKSYRIIVKTSPVVNNYGFNLDYLQLTQIHHANPLESWINSSEIIGGELWVNDGNKDSITGSGSATATKTIYPTYPFKEIYQVGITPVHSSGQYKARVTSIDGGNSFTALFKRDDNANWSETVNFRWWCKGLIEMPMIRLL